MYSVSQLIATTNSKHTLKKGNNTIVVDLLKDFDIDTLLQELRTSEFSTKSSLSLRLEQLQGNDLLPIIDIYLNLEQKNLPNELHYVGSMGLYGLGESSTASNEQDGYGQNKIFDVGMVFDEVYKQSNWSKKHFELTLIPSLPLQRTAQLTIGRIALFFHKG
jgi:hypothetical protein